MRQNKLLPKKIWLRYEPWYRNLVSLDPPLLMGGGFPHSPEALEVLVDLLQGYNRVETVVGCSQFLLLSLGKYADLE